MSDVGAAAFKVFAFLKRNTQLLSHDEYRAAHVGFHCSITRRLRNIRGYTVNIHDENASLGLQLASSGAIVVRNEPEGFLDLWDGFPAVHFDDREAWIHSNDPEPTRVTEEGLAIDKDWSLSDAPYLFDRISATSQFRSYHTRMEEQVVVSVMRREIRPCKLMQFFRRSGTLGEHEFRKRFVAEYLPLCSQLNGLNGFIANQRFGDIDAAVVDYYPAEHWCFSDEGRRFRESFYAMWDGANELFFERLDDFQTAREGHPHWSDLVALEEELFDAVWYVVVDENVIVMPNRSARPAFYYR
jgi:hypothetical protein